MIKNYREDEDLQNLIDWIQREWLKCCGITKSDDWDTNIYFKCTTNDPWIESCGVPPSCCYPEYMNNRQCGYGVRNKTRLGNEVITNKIYQDGCLKKGEEWLKYNILYVSIVIVVFAVFQVTFSFFFLLCFHCFSNFQQN
jgi:tetraspanin-5